MVIALVVGLVVASATNKSGSAAPPASNEVFLAAATSPGPNPFTPSVATASSVGAATTTTSAPPVSTVPTAPASYPGDTVGLYGGTLNLSSCNAAQMVRYLTANPSLGNAWAQAEGIPYASLAGYIANLTPVVLRGDTLVTNHGYSNGSAYPISEVLQAGTAVLVDSYGVPRARCYCGNPLTPPRTQTAVPTYTGPRWSSFSPGTVVIVAPAPAPLTSFTLVDTNTGQPFSQPAASVPRPPGSTTTTTAPRAPTTTTTTTLPPGLSAPGTLYDIQFMAGTAVGNAGQSQAQSNAQCASDLAKFQITRAAFVTSGNSILVRFSNIQLVGSGSYDPSSGSFTAASLEPSLGVLIAMKGVLGPQTVANGKLSENSLQVAFGCVWPFSGTRASTAPGSTTTAGGATSSSRPAPATTTTKPR